LEETAFQNRCLLWIPKQIFKDDPDPNNPCEHRKDGHLLAKLKLQVDFHLGFRSDSLVSRV
jgi:hypothetical protein